MTYKRFEDLPVWKIAIDLAVQVYALTRHRLFKGPGDLKSQLRRASLSVSNNIAEGFERGTTSELLTFLYIARGSAGEVRSMLRFAERMLAERGRGAPNLDKDRQADDSQSEISNLKSQISDDGVRGSQVLDERAELRRTIAELTSLAENRGRQIRGWAESLQNTDIRGQRHLTESSRRRYDADRRAEAFWERVEASVQTRLDELGK